MDLLLIALQEMDREIKEKRREWEKQGGREDQTDRKQPRRISARLEYRKQGS